jgi:hypothetical protein
LPFAFLSSNAVPRTEAIDTGSGSQLISPSGAAALVTQHGSMTASLAPARTGQHGPLRLVATFWQLPFFCSS